MENFKSRKMCNWLCKSRSLTLQNRMLWYYSAFKTLVRRRNLVIFEGFGVKFLAKNRFFEIASTARFMGQSWKIDFWPKIALSKPQRWLNFDARTPDQIFWTHYNSEDTVAIAFIPHGKIIHHGGCKSVDMPWMVDTFDRLEKYGIFSDSKKSSNHEQRTIIYLTAGAHFSIFNPKILYRRLEELKTVIYAFLDRHPGTLIIYRLSNFWGGSYGNRPLSGTSSSWNARRLNEIIRYVFEVDNRVKVVGLLVVP